MSASLVVSGGATAAQTGEEVVRYFSEPNRLAENTTTPAALERLIAATRGVEPVRAGVTLRGREHPRWQLRSTAEAFDPALLAGGEPGVPLAWSLQADGVEGAADLTDTAAEVIARNRG